MKKSATKKEKITFSNYQREAMKFCLKSCKNEDYFKFGLQAEMHELLAKIEGMRAKTIRGDYEGNADKLAKKRKEIRDEIGDVAWFLALGCELQKMKFATMSKLPVHYNRGLSMYYSHLSIYVPAEIKDVVMVLKRICREMNIKLSDALRANIAKLASRKARGKIQGDGDER